MLRIGGFVILRGFCFVWLLIIVSYGVFNFLIFGDGDGLFRNQRVESFRCKLGLFCYEIDFCKS